MTATDPKDIYLRRKARFSEERARRAALSRRIVHGRLAAFVLALAFVVWASVASQAQIVLLSASGLLLLAFVLLVWLHGRVDARVRWFDALTRVNQHATLRLDRSWDQLEEPSAVIAPNDHPYAADLHLFGRASLYKLLGTATTVPGKETLVDWLLVPVPPTVVVKRQEAVGELAGEIDFRDELAAQGRLIGSVRPAVVRRFLRWAADTAWLVERPVLLWAARVVPIVTIATAVLQLAGVLDRPFWVLSFLLGLGLSVRNWRTLEEILEHASAGDAGLRRYGLLFKHIGTQRFDSSRLGELTAQLNSAAVPAHVAMQRLTRWLAFGDVRYSDFLHAVLNVVTLWDFHVVTGLERWKTEYGEHLESWWSVLGEVEALAALAALSHMHPSWTFPVVSGEEHEAVMAEDMGHPLLHPKECVRNNVSVGPVGTFVLVSGSNMSGKSTLLRSVGLNSVLAQAGGPVCASLMEMPPVAVHTSVNVQDSLERGTSLFLAELTRVKQIVDSARRNEAEGNVRTLYLLDDVLHGTNTEERQIAVRRVLEALLRAGAIGMITTHDLALAASEDLREVSVPVHFREQVGVGSDGPTLTFDYELRTGLATSSNALTLMEIMGLCE